jgi:hypothetical protein
MDFPLPSKLTIIVLYYIIEEQKTNLAPYAAVNRDCEAIIERQTFSMIKLDTAKQ